MCTCMHGAGIKAGTPGAGIGATSADGWVNQAYSRLSTTVDYRNLSLTIFVMRNENSQITGTYPRALKHV